MLYICFPPNLTAQLVKIAARNRLRSRNDHWDAYYSIQNGIKVLQSTPSAHTHNYYDYYDYWKCWELHSRYVHFATYPKPYIYLYIYIPIKRNTCTYIMRMQSHQNLKFRDKMVKNRDCNYFIKIFAKRKERSHCIQRRNHFRTVASAHVARASKLRLGGMLRKYIRIMLILHNIFNILITRIRVIK